MDRHEQHHQHHLKEREHEKKEQRESERAWERGGSPVHPAWLLAVGTALVLGAVLVWVLLVP
jgi:hypothetical protein